MEYAVFANGTFWGIWTAETAEAACQQAADDVGTDGNTEGLCAACWTAADAERAFREAMEPAAA